MKLFYLNNLPSSLIYAILYIYMYKKYIYSLMKMNKNKKLFCWFLFYFPLSTSTINKQNKVSHLLFNDITATELCGKSSRRFIQSKLNWTCRSLVFWEHIHLYMGVSPCTCPSSMQDYKLKTDLCQIFVWILNILIYSRHTCKCLKYCSFARFINTKFYFIVLYFKNYSKVMLIWNLD